MPRTKIRLCPFGVKGGHASGLRSVSQYLGTVGSICLDHQSMPPAMDAASS